MKAKVLWTLKEAKGKGVDFCDASHEKEVQTRAQARPDFFAIRLKTPTAALAKALVGLEQGESVPSVASEWKFWLLCRCLWFDGRNVFG